MTRWHASRGLHVYDILAYNSPSSSGERDIYDMRNFKVPFIWYYGILLIVWRKFEPYINVTYKKMCLAMSHCCCSRHRWAISGSNKTCAVQQKQCWSMAKAYSSRRKKFLNYTSFFFSLSLFSPTTQEVFCLCYKSALFLCLNGSF